MKHASLNPKEPDWNVMESTPKSSFRDPDSAFRLSLAVTSTSFVNKCGDVGMSYFPMLLIERHMLGVQASTIMALVKGMAIFATLLGGYLGDKLGHKVAIICSFALAATGMTIMPFSHSAAAICAAGMITTLGHGLFMAPLRILLVRTVPFGMRREGLAWLRTANNAAVLVANCVAYVSSSLGLSFLFLFDAATSYIAAGLGVKRLPAIKDDPHAADKKRETSTLQPSSTGWWIAGFSGLVSLVCFNSFQAELFFVTAAAQARVSFGEKGVEVFALVMMVNTLMCMLLSVKATRLFKNVRLAFLLGFILQGIALVILATQKDYMFAYFIAAFFLTLGELAFAAMSQFALLQAIPPGPHEGKVYSLALVIQLLGKVSGGALAFSFLEGAPSWITAIVASTIGFSGLLIVTQRCFKRAHMSLG